MTKISMTDLRLLLDVATGYVYDEGGDAYNANARDTRVTWRLDRRLIEAGMVGMPEHPRRDDLGRRLYAVTDVGRGVLEIAAGREPGGAS